MADQVGDQHSVYLAGPITGCNKDQRDLWRAEFMQALERRHKGVTASDPTEWDLDFNPLRESLAIGTADIVVANMWKESIGTSVGIVQAVSVGKPVVVIDPNHINSRIVEGLVGAGNVTHSIAEAVARTDAILSSFRRIRVRKGDGTEQDFRIDKLLTSIQTACGAAQVVDPHLERFLGMSVLQKLRSRQGTSDVIPTSELRGIVFDVLHVAKENQQIDAETRAKIARVIEKWELKESYKNQDGTVANLSSELQAACAKRDVYKHLYEALAQRPVPAAPGEQHELVRLVDAVRQVQVEFPDSLIVLDKAKDSAKASPFRDVKKAFKMLVDIGSYGRDRLLATAEGRQAPSVDHYFEQRYGDNYAAVETGETMARYAKYRTFTYQGRDIVCQRHLKVGNSDDEHTLRVHFEHDSATGKMVVGHVGKHLKTYSSDG